VKVTIRNLVPGVILAAALLPSPVLGHSSASKKTNKSYRNINAIGHREVGCAKGMGNWYSNEQERSFGARLSASLEQSTALLRDPATTAYLDHLTQMIASNSDTQFPITIRVIESPDAYALTLPGGYQYITHGLLLQLQTEGELAAALARGIAHTSLCTEARLQTRASLAHMMTIPLILGGDPSAHSASDSGFAVPLTLLKFGRELELQADYFGIQYLYKSGYDPQCFVQFVQTAWRQPPPGKPVAAAFSPFPLLVERLKGLENEINDILPKRDGAVRNTPEFVSFREHLLTLSPPKPEPPKVPTLHWPDEQSSR